MWLRSGFKTPSEAQWLRCPAERDLHRFFYTEVHHRPPINAHILKYAGNNDFLDLSRHSPTLLEGRRRIGLTPFEHLNVLRSDAKSPPKREPLNLI